MIATECFSASPMIPASFWFLAIVTSYVVARYNNFGIKDALLVAVGLRKFKRNSMIYGLISATIAVPLGMFLASCTN